MLRAENIAQLIEEHRVFDYEPEVKGQNPIAVVLDTAARRGSLFGRGPILVDGLLVCWSFCWGPFCPQSTDYTNFIRSVRRQIFQDKTEEEAIDNARKFFLDGLLELEAHQLGEVLNRDGALEERPEGVRDEDRVQLFNVDMLALERYPRLHGSVYVRLQTARRNNLGA